MMRNNSARSLHMKERVMKLARFAFSCAGVFGVLAFLWLCALTVREPQLAVDIVRFTEPAQVPGLRIFVFSIPFGVVWIAWLVSRKLK